MRKAAVAGSFYPKSASELTKTIESCFEHKLGPGDVPVRKKALSPSIKAIIAPHAGYVYSGMAAAWAYSAIGEAELPDTFIIIGPNHHSGQTALALDGFETPFGLVRTDQEFIRALAEKGNVVVNDALHVQEHSIEVQLPFLQFVLGKDAERIRMVPLLLADDADIDAIALDIKETIIDLKRNVTFIVSSDFTHYGPAYHYVPFSSDVKKRIYEMDAAALDLIKAGNTKGLLEYIQKTDATICGVLPIVLMLKIIKFKKVLLEQYYTSGDLSEDYKNSVSYASLIFK